MPLLNAASVLANLAPTLFNGGPRDIVATPDVYGLTSNSINSNLTINSGVGKFNPFNSSLLNNLRSGSVGILSSLTGAANVGTLTNVGASYADPSIISRLTAVIGLPINSFSPSFQMALSQATNLNSANFSSLLVGNNGSYTSVTTTDVPGAIQSLSAMNQLAGTNLAMTGDAGAQNTAVSAITTTLIGLGLSGLLASFIQNQNANSGYSQAAATVALQQNVQQAIQASDISTVQLCITQLGVGGVLAKVPNAALQLVKYYRIPQGISKSEYAAQWTTLSGILVQLAPNWETVSWGGATYTSLTFFSAASADCKKIMIASGDTTLIAGATIGTKYPQQQALSTLESMYPYMLSL